MKCLKYKEGNDLGMKKTINDKDNDFGDIMILALRYSLGRRTYVTDEVPEFIMQNEEHINERICGVMLSDLNEYFQDRAKGYIKDDECDCQSWTKLAEYLVNLAQEKGYRIEYERLDWE